MGGVGAGRANRGAAGVDRVTLAMVEDYGVHRLLGELRRTPRRVVSSRAGAACGHPETSRW